MSRKPIRITWSPRDALGVGLRGFAMGAADIIPGVSGGTIALITGIYERFIAALHSISLSFVSPLVKGDLRESLRRLLAIDFSTLLPLMIGVVSAVAVMSRVIPHLMEDHPGQTYAFFFGLILASAWIPFAEMRARRGAHFGLAAAAAIGAFLFVGQQPPQPDLEITRTTESPVALFYPAKLRSLPELQALRDLRRTTDPNLAIAIFDPNGVSLNTSLQNAIRFEDKRDLEAYLADDPPLDIVEEKRVPLALIFLAGAVAISAMLLPGVSGAFLLLFMGQYYAVLHALKGTIDLVLNALGRRPDPLEIISGRTPMSDVVFIGVFNLGVLVGVVLFSRVIHWLLQHRHDATMAVLTGLMVGALHAPAKEVFQAARLASDSTSYWLVAGLVALGGAALVLLLTWLDARFRTRDPAESTS